MDKLWFICSIAAAGIGRLLKPKHGLVASAMAFIFVKASPRGTRYAAAREAMYVFLDKPCPPAPDRFPAELPEVETQKASDPACAETDDAVRRLRSAG